MKLNRTFFVLSALFCTSLLLGTLGFREHEELEWTTAFYKAVQLFNTNSGDLSAHPRAPLILELARWTALVFTLGAFAAVIASMFYGFRTWLRLKLQGVLGKTHDIICGAGEKGSALAADLLANGNPVVIVDVHGENSELESLRKRGGMVIAGDARQADVLTKAGISKASRVVCAAGEDSVNLSIAMTAAKLAIDRKAPLDIRVHISDVGHRDILERNNLLSAIKGSALDIKTFNFFRNKARQTLQNNPLELDNNQTLCDDVHILLSGLHRFETALAVQAALIGHYRNGGKCTIHVICENPAKEIAQLLKSYPNFEKCCHLRSHPLGSDELVPKAAQIIAGLPAASFCTVFLCSGDSGEMFTEALLLKDLLPENDRFRVVISPPADSYLREIVARHSSEGHPLSRWISFSRPNSESCGQDAVFNESLDRLAMRIHEVWYQQQLKESAKPSQSKVDGQSSKVPEPWHRLDEALKDSNRFAADHVTVKVRAAGFDPSEFDRLREQWLALDANTLEMLARVEHERWCAAKWIGGWILAPEYNEKRRQHHCLVPYDGLTHRYKENDRNQVKAAAGHLIACTQAK